MCCLRRLFDFELFDFELNKIVNLLLYSSRLFDFELKKIVEKGAVNVLPS